MIYITYFLLATIISFFVSSRKQALSFIVFLTFSFLAFSYPAGGDWVGYFGNYDCLVNNKCYSGFVEFEVGYEFLVKTIGQLGFQPLLIFIAFLNLIFISSFAKKFENSALIVLFIMCVFLWSLYMEAIRQSIAISLVLWGIYLLYLGKLKEFILIVLLSSLFHITALITLLFTLPYFSKRISKLVAWGIVGISFIFVSMPTQFLQLLLLVLPLDSMAGAKLNFYLSSDAYKPQLSIGIGTILDVLLIGLIIVSFRRVRLYKLYNDIRFHHVVYLGVALYLAFGVFIGKMMPVFTRIGWYGYPLIIILLYTNIGNSMFYRKSRVGFKYDLRVTLVCMYFLLQTIRPFTYDYNNFGIMNQETIIQNINNLDDASLRIAAREKCLALTRLGYGYLCD
ncbi:EpsG family protein [Acinetobacter proteolyticus]|jgi:hypothetical protein|nr:EpsG family protein [Acinetobacter proteolyticus]WEI19377.1 EpsG family protein [Acinetobacter proteolyticus]